jgi:hypothetical protein
MDATPFVPWLFLLLGAAISFVWGRKSGSGKPPGGWGAALGITIVLAPVSCFLIGFGLAGCVALKFCRASGDTGLIYVFYPIVGAPVYWLIAGVASQDAKE